MIVEKCFSPVSVTFGRRFFSFSAIVVSFVLIKSEKKRREKELQSLIVRIDSPLTHLLALQPAIFYCFFFFSLSCMCLFTLIEPFSVCYSASTFSLKQRQYHQLTVEVFHFVFRLFFTSSLFSNIFFFSLSYSFVWCVCVRLNTGDRMATANRSIDNVETADGLYSKLQWIVNYTIIESKLSHVAMVIGFTGCTRMQRESEKHNRIWHKHWHVHAKQKEVERKRGKMESSAKKRRNSIGIFAENDFRTFFNGRQFERRDKIELNWINANWNNGK